MPRQRMMGVNGEDAVYHVMSRTALNGYVLGDIEKELLPGLIKKAEFRIFCGSLADF